MSRIHDAFLLGVFRFAVILNSISRGTPPPRLARIQFMFFYGL
jgi:hypothetical protein